MLYTKPFFWQKDLNFEASGENAILGELTINWTFTFLHKSFGAQRIERVGVEKEEEEVGITKLCRKQVRNLFLAFKDKQECWQNVSSLVLLWHEPGVDPRTYFGGG